MAVSLQEDAHDTFQDTLNSCPHNTQLSHSSKQAELKTWKLSQHFEDTVTVTGENIHSFLNGDVCGRKRMNDNSKAVIYSTVR